MNAFERDSFKETFMIGECPLPYWFGLVCAVPSHVVLGFVNRAIRKANAAPPKQATSHGTR